MGGQVTAIWMPGENCPKTALTAVDWRAWREALAGLKGLRQTAGWDGLPGGLARACASITNVALRNQTACPGLPALGWKESVANNVAFARYLTSRKTGLGRLGADIGTLYQCRPIKQLGCKEFCFTPSVPTFKRKTGQNAAQKWT